MNFLGGFSKNTQIKNLIKVSPVGAESFHVDGKTDRQTDLKKLIVAFCNLVNAPKLHPHRELQRTGLWYYDGSYEYRLWKQIMDWHGLGLCIMVGFGLGNIELPVSIISCCWIIAYLYACCLNNIVIAATKLLPNVKCDKSP